MQDKILVVSKKAKKLVERDEPSTNCNVGLHTDKNFIN